jgi:hypothetical protein
MMSSIKSALAGSHLPDGVQPSIRRHQQFEDMKCGSRRAFVTDMYINGEYLRSRTDNQYFCVVDKPRRSATSGYTGDFRNLDEATRIRKTTPKNTLYCG